VTTPVSPNRKVLAGVAFLAGAAMFHATALAGGVPSSSPHRTVTAASLRSAAALPPVAARQGVAEPDTQSVVVPSDGIAASSVLGPLPVSTNPSASMAPPAAFISACFGAVTTTSGCNAAALAAVNSARAAEGYGPLGLPSGYATMTMAEQILVVANAERTSRGLPSFTEVTTLDRMALAGAKASTDPTGPSNSTWGSNVAWGYPNALAVDFAWMYDDGVGSPNIDCPSAGAVGCWGHRENILVSWPGQAGVAALSTPKGWVLTELFVELP